MLLKSYVFDPFLGTEAAQKLLYIWQLVGREEGSFEEFST